MAKAKDKKLSDVIGSMTLMLSKTSVDDWHPVLPWRNPGLIAQQIKEDFAALMHRCLVRYSLTLNKLAKESGIPVARLREAYKARCNLTIDEIGSIYDARDKLHPDNSNQSWTSHNLAWDTPKRRKSEITRKTKRITP